MRQFLSSLYETSVLTPIMQMDFILRMLTTNVPAATTTRIVLRCSSKDTLLLLVMNMSPLGVAAWIICC